MYVVRDSCKAIAVQECDEDLDEDCNDPQDICLEELANRMDLENVDPADINCTECQNNDADVETNRMELGSDHVRINIYCNIYSLKTFAVTFIMVQKM